MSQAKVDRYKKEKADRKKTMRKEKIMRNVKRCVAGVIALAIVGAITNNTIVETIDIANIIFSAIL